MRWSRSAAVCSWVVVSAAACSPEPLEAQPSPDAGAAHPAFDAGPARRPEEACAECHPNHVEEWRMSPHAYAMVDPVFHAMVRLGQAETEGEMGDFCVQCHSPFGTRTGEAEIAFDGEAGVYRQRTEDLGLEAMAGVSCNVCHSITRVNTTANADFEMAGDTVRRATIRKPVSSPAHVSEFSPLHGNSDICGTCHQVVARNFGDDSAIALERTFAEWVASRFNGAQSCQQCHMKAYDGQAAPGGPERELHRHTFVGVDVSLVPPDDFPGYEELRTLTEDLLQSSAELSLTYLRDSDEFEVLIENLAGHALPSGAVADRQMWVELIVRNDAGKVVFGSGTLDDNGDLRVDNPELTTEPGTDPQLALFAQQMYFDPSLLDPASTESRRQVDFLWQPNAMEELLVPAGGRSRPRYDLSELEPGTYTAQVRLLFRSFAPHLLRKLEKEADLDPDVRERLPTTEMESASLEFTVEP